MTDIRNKSSKAAASADADSIVSEIQIVAPAQRVFQALTDERELVRWFNDASCPVKLWKMDARPGGHYRYSTEKGTVVVNGVGEFECHGEILEFVPPRLLVYTWIANWHENKSLRTVVRWELTPAAGGTHVRVTHSGLSSEPAAHKDYSGGWPGVMQMLKSFAEKQTK
jgi:uncharacterized protein YndB with AHSA1/START domain